MDKSDLEKIRNSVLGDFFFYERVGSTNREAFKLSDAKDKSLIVAENQTDGRGRLGRSWEASEGGIYMTILLMPKRIREDTARITLITGLAVSRAIEGSYIKWPNDIILGDKKVSGILAETRISGDKGRIAVGIGINANNRAFSHDLEKKATSIYLLTGKKQDIAEIIVRVYSEFVNIYEDFEGGFSAVLEEYRKRCITLNREIMVFGDGKKRVMTAKGINERGELLAEFCGKTETIAFGEVSVRGILGYL